MKYIAWGLESPDTRTSVKSVEVTTGGWSVSLFDGTGLFVPDDVCQRMPDVGEPVKLIGDLGHPIRGIEIGGRCYRYLTREEQRAEHATLVAKMHAEAAAEAVSERAARAAQIAALPAVFQDRIAGFKLANPTFDRDFEPYEIFCCEQAVLFASKLKTKEAIVAFSELTSSSKQRELVPELSHEHSGNTFGASVALAIVFVERPERVPQLHGALCPLVGCKDYGCVGAARAKS